MFRVIDNTSFVINSGISTRAHFYARCETVKKPIDIVFDSPLSYTNLPLNYVSGTTDWEQKPQSMLLLVKDPVSSTLKLIILDMVLLMGIN